MSSRRERLAIAVMAGIEVAALAGLIALVATRALERSPGETPFGGDLPAAPPLVRVALSCLFGGAIGGVLAHRALGERRRVALGLLLPGAVFLALGWATALWGSWGRMELSAERLELRRTRGWCVPFLGIPVTPSRVDYRPTHVTPALESMGLVLATPREAARWDLVHSWEPGVKCALGSRRHMIDHVWGNGGQLWARLLATDPPERWRVAWRDALELARDGETSQARDLLERALPDDP